VKSNDLKESICVIELERDGVAGMTAAVNET
jgi:hypothetical protein